MLPIATPPNAVVFGSGKVNIDDMIKAGLVLNLVSVFVVTFVTLLILNVIFNYDLMSLPEWVIKS